jgi:hypothetical protein
MALGAWAALASDSGPRPITTMTDHFRYDLLTQQALRGVVRNVLTEVAKKKTLPGDHHFYISFDTHGEGVRISERLRVQYPEQMTIILQHQFWDLTVHERGFEVGLSFGGIPEKLSVPFEAINGFFDPSVQFGLQFEEVTEGQDRQAPANAQAKAQDKPVRKKRATPPRPPWWRPRRCRPIRRLLRQRRLSRSPTGPRAVPKSCGSTVSVRSSQRLSPPRRRAYTSAWPKSLPKPAKRRASKAMPLGRSRSPPTSSGARRPNARCTISASAQNACRSRSCARSA